MIFVHNSRSKRSWSKIGRYDVNHGHPAKDFVLRSHSVFKRF
jgi:hypothetical protein